MIFRGLPVAVSAYTYIINYFKITNYITIIRAIWFASEFLFAVKPGKGSTNGGAQLTKQNIKLCLNIVTY